MAGASWRPLRALRGNSRLTPPRPQAAYLIHDGKAHVSLGYLQDCHDRPADSFSPVSGGSSDGATNSATLKFNLNWITTV